jgi:hypothetical protein
VLFLSLYYFFGTLFVNTTHFLSPKRFFTMNITRTLVLLVTIGTASVITAGQKPYDFSKFCHNLRYGTKKVRVCITHVIDATNLGEFYTAEKDEEANKWIRTNPYATIKLNNDYTISNMSGNEQCENKPVRVATRKQEYTESDNNERIIVGTAAAAFTIYCLRHKIAAAYTYAATGIANYFWDTPEQIAAAHVSAANQEKI